MKKLLLATALLLVLPINGHAAVIEDLGVNPTSAAGAFSHVPGAGPFDDQLTFQLVGGPKFITIASVTNTFADPVADFIANFTGSVFNSVDGIVGNGNDVRVIGPANAVACPLTPDCQGFAGSALLNPGSYYLDISGNAGTTAGYGGNLSVAAVPVPLAGAGLPGLLAAALALFGINRRRRAGSLA
jgi:hypothetical protein